MTVTKETDADLSRECTQRISFSVLFLACPLSFFSHSSWWTFDSFAHPLGRKMFLIFFSADFSFSFQEQQLVHDKLCICGTGGHCLTAFVVVRSVGQSMPRSPKKDEKLGVDFCLGGRGNGFGC